MPQNGKDRSTATFATAIGQRVTLKNNFLKHFKSFSADRLIIIKTVIGEDRTFSDPVFKFIFDKVKSLHVLPTLNNITCSAIVRALWYGTFNGVLSLRPILVSVFLYYISGHNLANTYFKSGRTKSIFLLMSYSHFTSFLKLFSICVNLLNTKEQPWTVQEQSM